MRDRSAAPVTRICRVWSSARQRALPRTTAIRLPGCGRPLNDRTRLEWDERKRLANLAQHGLDFLAAELISRGALYSYSSERQGEQRW